MKPIKSTMADELNATIRDEKRSILQELLGEAWDIGIEAGIEPVAIAEVFIQASFEELCESDGSESAVRLAHALAEAIDQGLLPLPRNLQ